MFKVIHQRNESDPVAFQRALEQARDRILEVALSGVPSRLDEVQPSGMRNARHERIKNDTLDQRIISKE